MIVKQKNITIWSKKMWLWEDFNGEDRKVASTYEMLQDYVTKEYGDADFVFSDTVCFVRQKEDEIGVIKEVEILQ